MALLKNITSGLFNRSTINSDFIVRNRKIVADFAKETGKDITLIDAQIWPWRSNSKKTVKAVVRHLRHMGNIRAIAMSEEAVSFQINTYANTPNVFYREFSTLLFRHSRVDDLMKSHLRYNFASPHLIKNLNDYVLYQNLYQACTAKLDITKNNFIHKMELFGDFAACLTLLSKGEDIFLDVARMRALEMRYGASLSTTIGGDASFSYFSANLNHHLYVSYKHWSKENSDVDVRSLTIPEIIDIAAECTEKYAHSESVLRSYYEASKKAYPNNYKLKARKRALRSRLDKLNQPSGFNKS